MMENKATVRSGAGFICIFEWCSFEHHFTFYIELLLMYDFFSYRLSSIQLKGIMSFNSKRSTTGCLVN